MDSDEVVRRLHKAYGVLAKQDLQLLELDANERSITHKLAEHLQVEFHEWHVDCEYNRDGGQPKRVHLAYSVPADDTDAVTVFPDIVVHHRDTQDNLLVIEAKKSSSVQQSQDEEKLAAYVADLGYRYAFKIVFPIGDLADGAIAERDIVEFEPHSGAPLGGNP